MNRERILGESAQFGPRKIVGRPATPRQILWQLEQIRQFTDKHDASPNKTISQFEAVGPHRWSES